MKQAVLTAPGTLEFNQVDTPKPGRGEVLIQVKAIGICGSDIHTFHGKHPFVHCPIVLGHEATGRVVELGEGAEGLEVGDRVVMRPQIVCGECKPCKQGRYNICEKLNVLGCLGTGASSEYFAAPAELFYKLPDSLDYGTGTIIEPLAVGVHAVRRGGDVRGKNVLVVGAGTIGNVTAQAAKGLDAKSVMITDVSDFKLEMARECGIDHCVNVRRQNLAEEADRAFGDVGVHLIIECSASEAALDQAIDIAPKGINIVIAGVFEDPAKTDMAAVQDREYSLIGTLMYLHQDYLDAIDMVEKGKVYLEKLITNRYPFDENLMAYHHIDNNRDTVQKVIVEIG